MEISAKDDFSGAAPRTHDILSSLTALVIMLDSDGRVVQLNEAAEALFRKTAREVTGRAWQELHLPWEEQRIEELLRPQPGAVRKSSQREVRIAAKDGDARTYAFMASPVKRSTAVTRLGTLLVEHGHLDPEVVARALELQLRGDMRPLGVILVEDFAVPAEDVAAALAHQQTLQGDGDGGTILLGVDLTERRVLEGQLAHHQKLEAIGQLAAGIAHEINTPTQFIGDNLRFLQESYAQLVELLRLYGALAEAASAGEAGPELLAAIREQASEADLEYLMTEIPVAIAQSLEGNARVASIVRAMKEFSHPGTEGFTTVDINHAIESTLTVARNEYKYVAEVETILDPHLPPVPCLPSELNQVFLNLLVNAAHAIGDNPNRGTEKGTITIVTRRDGDWAQVEVRDTGQGIPEEIRPRIFDPFFTTKRVGKGTGQGLAIAHAVIVKKHRGRITFESEVGRGTSFTLYLPLRQEGLEENEELGSRN